MEYLQSLLAWLGDNFSTYVLVQDNAVQLITLVILLLTAKLVAAPLKDRHRAWTEKRGRPLAPGTMRNAVNILLFPALWLALTWVCIFTATYLGWPRALLHIAGSLLAAWIVIRFTTTLFRNPFLTNIIAVLAWSIAALNILGILDLVIGILDSAELRLGAVNVTVLAVLKGLVYLAILLWAAGMISRLLESRLEKSVSLTPSVAVLTGKLVRIALYASAFLFAISSVGIDLTVFAVFGGALGVGLGFGLQKVVSNFVSGIILLLDKSIKPGDVISVGETYGWVKSLNARYVSLDTRDGIEHLIPNEDLIVQRVENWSYSHNRIRLKIPVGVHYQSDIHLAIRICIEAAAGNPRVLKDPAPVCPLKGFGDSSVDLEVRLWINDPQNGISNIKSEILLEIWDRFHEQGIEIPYPQRDVHIKTPLSVQENKG